MKISFFEEFPEIENLEKLEMVGFDTTVFLACESVSEFRELEEKVKGINEGVECAYWPVLKESEGYWMSPFSDPEALDRVIDELREEKDLKVLWDAELPFLRSSLFWKNLIYFFRNKRKIRNFLSEKSGELTFYSAEFFSHEWLMKALGVSFDENVIKTPMCYTSFVPGAKSALKKLDSRAVGLGLIAKGVGPTDRVFEPSDLREDLELAESNGVNEAIIFRLGGLNEDYLEVIEDFV